MILNQVWNNSLLQKFKTARKTVIFIWMPMMFHGPYGICVPCKFSSKISAYCLLLKSWCLMVGSGANEKAELFSLSYPNLQNKLLIIKRIFRRTFRRYFWEGRVGEREFSKTEKKSNNIPTLISSKEKKRSQVAIRPIESTSYGPVVQLLQYIWY